MAGIEIATGELVKQTVPNIKINLNAQVLVEPNDRGWQVISMKELKTGDKLLCPFCGGVFLPLGKYSNGWWGYRCYKCGVVTQWDDREKAKKFGNSRV